ncbi:hypothetical protein H8D57_01855 [bacterium]|nr:hypothetical protein [bacterium]
MGSEYLSASIWAIVTAASLLLIFLALGIYLWYWSRVKAVVQDASSAADLAAEKDQLEAEIAQCRTWLENNKEDLLKLDAERQQQEVLRQELADQQTKVAQEEQKADALRKEAIDLQNVVSSLTKDRDRLETETVDLENKRDAAKEQAKTAEEVKVHAHIKTKEAQEDLGEKLREIKELNDKITEQTLNKGALAKEINDKKSKLDKLNQDLKNAESEAQHVFKAIDEEKHRLEMLKNENEKFQHEIDEKRRHFNELVEKVTERSFQNDTLAKEIDSKQTKREDLKTILTKLKAQQDEAEQKFEQLKGQLSVVKQEFKDTKDELAIQERFEKEAALKVQKLNLEVDRLKSEETALKSSIKSLEVLIANKQLDGQNGDTAANEEKYRDLWHPVSFPDLSPVDGSPIERQLLKDTADYIKGQKLYFHDRVLYAFHTALKINDISPLVVLAGISGTGKSELPRRYAEGMGLHFVMLAVQPRWDSPQDIFGFYNYLEGRYKATEPARAMVHFEKYNTDLWLLPQNWNHNRSDRMLLVLFDEMNLAHVEYYFSDFLSRLETRRGINQEDKNERAKAEIAIEMGSLREGEDPIRLFPGQNILFTGTMNEDETTQALSDKVLDRACVMRFGRPKQIIEQIDGLRTSPSDNGLTFDQWNSWLKEKLSPSDKDRVNNLINDLNNAMDSIDRPFGHRVAQAIQLYVANYPEWVPNRIQVAMADQIEHRILPKLRGIEIADAGGPIHRIQSIIEQCEDQHLLNAFKQGSSNQQIFIWRGIDRTEY